MSKKHTTTSTRQIETLFTRAQLKPATVNAGERTVDVVFATETPVKRYDWESGYFNEVLKCDKKSVDFTRLNAGGPVLNTHSSYKLTDQIGKVENPRIENGECVATLRFSKRESVNEIWGDVEDGIYTNISVGYNVSEYTVRAHKEGDTPTWDATRWTPAEISLVPIPADINSGTRNTDAEQKHTVTIITPMKDATTTPEGSETTVPATEAAATSAPTTPPVATPAPTANADEQRNAATAAATTRALDISKAVRVAGLPSTVSEELTAGNFTTDEARSEIFKRMEAAQKPIGGQHSGTQVRTDEADKKRTGIQAGLLAKIEPNAENLKAAGEFRGMSLMELGTEVLRLNGVSFSGATKRERAQLILGQQVRGFGMHTTSDFPILMGNLFNTTLRKKYDLQERTFQPWTTRSTVEDFRMVYEAQTGDLGAFDKVLEGGEYKSATLAEGKEGYKAEKYGRILNLSWEMLINDNLGAFNNITREFAVAASQTQSNLVYGILLDNPVMGDGVALFHANHNNLGTAAAITIDSVGAARAKFRKQKSLGGNLLNITPKYLIVGPDQEQAALQFVSTAYVAQNSADINVWRTLLTVVVEARITGNQWFLAADPNVIDGLKYFFLDGEELYTEEREAFDVDAYQYKARMVFGAKAIDYRALYKNPGL